MRRRLTAFGAFVAVGCGAPSALPRATHAQASTDGATRAAPSAAPSASASLAETREAAIKGRFGTSCHLAQECAELLGIDCESASDGPYYYVEARTLKVVARCGGYCDGATCTSCPPRSWTCATP